MAKQGNQSPTVRITISTTPHVAQLLEWLAETQLYGKNRAAVAEELLRTKVREIATEQAAVGNNPPKHGGDNATT